jgi:hypothetical protein
VEFFIVITSGAGAGVRCGVGIPPILKLEIAYIFSVAAGNRVDGFDYGND